MAETCYAVSLENASKVYRIDSIEVPALKNTNIQIATGEYIAIMGPSGSGKTTLLNILGCLDKLTFGHYFLDGEDVSLLSDDRLSEIRNRKIGFIFQSYNLIPELSVLENIAVPLFYRGHVTGEQMKKVKTIAERVGLGDRLHHRPSQLSGGQQQRVAIARSLINDPVLILADEPTGNLDSVTGKEILAILDRLHQEKRTLVVVTHDDDVAEHTERIIRLADGEVCSPS